METFSMKNLSSLPPVGKGGKETDNEKTSGMIMQEENKTATSDSTIGEESAKSKNDDSPLADFPGGDFPDRNGQHHPIAEFLYQLTKMLTDDNNEIIEWRDGRIKVHYPERLEAEVLHKYFRHSRFASFQRQLNYFGFRKIAGKGKMSPCSYVNESATSDIRSLLLIKRKTNGSAARKAASLQRKAAALAAEGMAPALAAGGVSLIAANPTAPGSQPIALINGQAISNAMALLSDNALRAGLGQFQLQQAQGTASLGSVNPLLALQHHQTLQQQLQQLQHAQQQANASRKQHRHAQPQHSTGSPSSRYQQQSEPQPQKAYSSSQFKLEHRDSSERTKHSSDRTSTMLNTPSLEQLHAHLAASYQNGQHSLNASALTASGLNLASSMNATAALKQMAASSSAAAEAKASAAVNAQSSAMPATAAMDAASATAQTNNNLFESAVNLKSLLNEHNGGDRPNAAPISSQTVLNHRLPSSSQIFPEMSTASFGNLLGSSNRLSSLLSLNSFFGSREPSLADFAAAMPPNMSAHQLPGSMSQIHADARRSN